MTKPTRLIKMDMEFKPKHAGTCDEMQCDRPWDVRSDPNSYPGSVVERTVYLCLKHLEKANAARHDFSLAHHKNKISKIQEIDREQAKLEAQARRAELQAMRADG